jgi:DNA topoisomerase IB
VIAFADALPAIREQVREHMALRGLPREKVLATVVHLLETTLIRVGNGDYAKQNSSYGLTTLKNRHVLIEGNEVRFRFTGKSGKQWSLRVKDRNRSSAAIVLRRHARGSSGAVGLRTPDFTGPGCVAPRALRSYQRSHRRCW